MEIEEFSFHFEECDSDVLMGYDGQPTTPESGYDIGVELLTSSIRLLTHPPELLKVRQDVELALENVEAVMGDASLLASDLMALGYNVTLRKAVGGGHSFKNLRHVFIVIHQFGSPELIVETNLRELFEIQKPSLLYAEMMKSLPRVFVGPIEVLIQLLQGLSHEMYHCFATQGRDVPPWRKADAYLSRWIPKYKQDLPVTYVHRSPSLMDQSPQSFERASYQGKSSWGSFERNGGVGKHMLSLAPSISAISSGHPKVKVLGFLPK